MTRSRRALYSACVFIAVLGGLELLARQQSITLPGWQGLDNPSVVMVGHPGRLWGLGFGSRDNAGETATINGDGLRGATIERPRPEERSRILVLGDSSFFGFGLPDTNTLDVALVEQLSANGIHVDGVNGGVPGYSTEQTRLLLEDVAWSMDPTLLIVGSLWSDTNFSAYRDRDLLYTATFATQVRARSAAYRWFASILSGWFRSPGERVITWDRTDSTPEETLRRVSLDRYAENLKWIAEEAASRGVGTLLVSPTAKIETDATMTGEIQWSAYRSAQASVAAHMSIPFVDTRPVFMSAQNNTATPSPFLDDLHPSISGIQLMAEQITTTLLDTGWPKNRLLAHADGPDIVLATDTFDGEPLPAEERVQSPVANLFTAAQTQPQTQPMGEGTQGESAVLTIMGEVAAVDPSPITLRFRAAAGNISANVTLLSPGPFQVRVPADGGPWTIEASQGEGDAHMVKVDPNLPVMVILP